MRIFMLGWEFPPFLAGGLGTACHGLTKSLAQQGHEILFVLPQSVPDDLKTHVQLLGPNTLTARAEQIRQRAAVGASAPPPVGVVGVASESDGEGVPLAGGRPGAGPSAVGADAGPVGDVTSHPYPGIDFGDTLTRVVDRLNAASGGVGGPVAKAERFEALRSSSAGELAAAMDEVLGSLEHMGTRDGGYGGDLFGDAQRYAGLAAALGVHERFDVIHAHDWLTYPSSTVRASTSTGRSTTSSVRA